MDTTALDNCRQVIERVLSEYAAIPYALEKQIERKVIFDQQRDSYLLMITGWGLDGRRVHGCIIHIDIIDRKLWIQRDGTESGVAADLEAAGIAKEQIVLGFREPELRPLSGYALS